MVALLVALGWIWSYWRIEAVSVSQFRFPSPDVWQVRTAGIQMLRGQLVLAGGRQEGDAYFTSRGINSNDAAQMRQQSTRTQFDRTFLAISPLMGTGVSANRLRFGYASKTVMLKEGPVQDIRVVVPAWSVLIITLVLPVSRGVGWYRQRRKPREGCCKKCGYDLRATPERCPECGTGTAIK